MSLCLTMSDGRRIDLATAIDLARPIAFDAADARAFGAPAPRSTPLVAGAFTGAVVDGASCNCRTLTLTPHCNGTHTECVAHLTAEALDAWRVVPIVPVTAIVVTVMPVRQGDDRVITRAALDAAWHGVPPDPAAVALIVRTAGAAARSDSGAAMAPYFSADAAESLAARGILHLVLDLPSLDRSEDQGRLAAHRAFFGLPAGSHRLADAARPQATITEFAQIPAALPDGPCALAWQVPALAGDAVPSRPLAYRYLP